MVYNLNIVTTVYLLTFALALVPVLSQMVATAFVWKGIALVLKPKEARTTPLWHPFLMGGVAFAFMLWHIAHTIAVFFPDYGAADFQHKNILGVSVPIELADKVQNLVSAIPYMLISLYVVGMCFWILFKPREELVKAKAPVWTLKLTVAGGIVLIVWTNWASWMNFIASVRAFF